jgi:hypothetical protein
MEALEAEAQVVHLSVLVAGERKISLYLKIKPMKLEKLCLKSLSMI